MHIGDRPTYDYFRGDGRTCSFSTRAELQIVSNQLGELPATTFEKRFPEVPVSRFTGSSCERHFAGHVSLRLPAVRSETVTPRHRFPSWQKQADSTTSHLFDPLILDSLVIGKIARRCDDPRRGLTASRNAGAPEAEEWCFQPLTKISLRRSTPDRRSAFSVALPLSETKRTRAIVPNPNLQDHALVVGHRCEGQPGRIN